MAINTKKLSMISIYVLLFSTIYPRTITSSRTPASSPTESNSSPTPSSSQTPGPSTGSPISLSEMFELALPDIGIQKAAVAPQTEESKVACKQLEAIEHRISEFKVTVTKRMENTDANIPERTKLCLTDCLENFDGAIEGVQKGIDSINKKDMSSANNHVSAVKTDIRTCNDCFMEGQGEIPEDKDIKALNDWVQGVASDILVILKKAES